jgi:SAM-dependent methyltransferase
MDLTEINHRNLNRHPWEIARVEALKKILHPILNNQIDQKILDIGCGDGFVSMSMFEQNFHFSVSCLDIFFTPEQIHELKTRCPRFNYTNTYESLRGEKFNLILLLDVLEHEKDDGALLKVIIENFLAAEGKILIATPAFQALFGTHDHFLKHFRRYSRRELINLSKIHGLSILNSGYMFSLLLFPRALSVLLQKLVSPSLIKGRGVGSWNHNRMTTGFASFLLSLDNGLLLWLNKYQIPFPGLTAWVLCQKQPSLYPVTTKPAG